MRTCTGLTLLVLLQAEPLEAGSVKGRVILRSEDGSSAIRFIPGRHRIVYSSSAVASQGCGEAVVTNMLDIAVLEIKPPCSTEHLQAELMLQHNDLSLKQEPRPLMLPACTEEVCGYIMEVHWPRKKSPGKRAEYFQKGMQLYTTDPESSLAYLADASWGAMDYTKATADQLEKDKRFQDLWMFLDTTEAGLHEADRVARFDLSMQKARAANAAQNTAVTLQAAADALKLNPADPSPVAVVREQLVWTAKSSSADNIALVIEADPEAKKAFDVFYSAWEVEGKSPELGPDSIRNKVAFTLKGAGPAENQIWFLGQPGGGEPILAMGRPFDSKHKWFGRLSGDWTFASKTWTRSDQPPLESVGTMRANVVLDGKYVEQIWKGSFMGAPLEGRGTEGFDEMKNQYVRMWADDMGTGIMTATGTCSESGGSCFYVSTVPDPMSGQKQTTRSVVTWLSDNLFTEETYGIDASGNQEKLMEIVVKRKP
jgi:hypothetical protein